MKQLLLAAGIALLCLGQSEDDQPNAQTLPTDNVKIDTLRHMVRIYEDDDFINIRGCGTDNAYTNGTRLDYFYQLSRRSKTVADRFLPTAGSNSVNAYGWGMMQLMYTPNIITDAAYQPNDYPWSGALIATHTLYSYDPIEKYDLLTELDLGVIGPAALDRQTQTLVHELIHYDRPRGWSHQFRNDLLANVNVTSERQFAGNGSTIEVIGGGQLSAGTMINSLTLYPLLRIGRMHSYFEGFFRQYGGEGRTRRRDKDWQFYFICRPEVQFILTEAVLQGGLFTRNPNLAFDHNPSKSQQEPPAPPQPYHPINHVVVASNFGVVASTGDFAISFNQNSSTAMMKGLYPHEVGNISLYFSWQTCSKPSCLQL
jgi:lipid A 3-O-deacylase